MVLLYFSFVATQHYTTSLLVLKYLLLLTRIREMKHLQDSHIYNCCMILIKFCGFYILPIACLRVINFNIKGLATNV